MTIQRISNTTICSIFLTYKNHHCNQVYCSDDFKRREIGEGGLFIPTQFKREVILVFVELIVG
jgi:hypothetical protein